MKDISVVLTGKGTHFEVDTEAAFLITIDRNDDKAESQVALVGCANCQTAVKQLASGIFNIFKEVDRLSPGFHQAIDSLRSKDPNAPEHIYDLFLYEFFEKLEEHGYV